MIFQEPKKWATWLSLVEWWYNTSYHTGTKESPFLALLWLSSSYDYIISEIIVPGPADPDARDFWMRNKTLWRNSRPTRNKLMPEWNSMQLRTYLRSNPVWEICCTLICNPIEWQPLDSDMLLNWQLSYMDHLRCCRWLEILPTSTTFPTISKYIWYFMLISWRYTRANSLFLINNYHLLVLMGKSELNRRQNHITAETRSVSQSMANSVGNLAEEASWEDANFIKNSFPPILQANHSILVSKPNHLVTSVV